MVPPNSPPASLSPVVRTECAVIVDGTAVVAAVLGIGAMGSVSQSVVLGSGGI